MHHRVSEVNQLSSRRIYLATMERRACRFYPRRVPEGDRALQGDLFLSASAPFAQAYLFPRIIPTLRVSPANFSFLLRGRAWAVAHTLARPHPVRTHIHTPSAETSATGLEAPITTYRVQCPNSKWRQPPRRAISFRRRLPKRDRKSVV